MTANFSYVGGGSAHPEGAAPFGVEFFYTIRFAVGSTAYVCRAASRRGRLEPVVIKKFKLLANPSDVLYTDTLNGLWNEDELCTHGEAIQRAIAYYERQQAMAEQLLDMT
jgi:hypothetical protein